MNSVKVDKKELLKTIKKNRDNHRNTFLIALEGYRQESIEMLEKRVSDLKNKKNILRQEHLIQPVDQTDSYDRAIQMLEMSVDDVIEISTSEFQNYVMDKWNWSDNFLTSNKPYLDKMRSSQ